jgi:hypothetical protein
LHLPCLLLLVLVERAQAASRVTVLQGPRSALYKSHSYPPAPAKKTIINNYNNTSQENYSRHTPGTHTHTYTRHRGNIHTRTYPSHLREMRPHTHAHTHTHTYTCDRTKHFRE